MALTVAVVGASGFIGSHLGAELDRRQIAWCAVRRGTLGQRPDAAVVVVLLRPANPWVAATTSLQIRAWGLPTVLASSNAVYERPLSQYAVSKLVQEWLLPGWQVRLPHVWGRSEGDLCVLDRWRLAAQQGQPLLVLEPDRVLDFVHVRRVAALLADLAQQAGKGAPRRVAVKSGIPSVTLWALAQQMGGPLAQRVPGSCRLGERPRRTGMEQFWQEAILPEEVLGGERRN